QARFTAWRVAKLSEQSRTTLLEATSAPSPSSCTRCWRGTTFTSGFIFRSASRPDAALGLPTDSVVWRIWRCRLVRSTVSPSARVIVPTPAAARYSAAGEPSPPAPMTRAEDPSSFSCPSTPISGSRICREYLRSCSSFINGHTGSRDEPRAASVPSRGDKAARSASALSILDRRGRRALRGGERHALQELERLLELEVLFRGELERRRRFFFRVDRWFCTGTLRFIGLGFSLLVVEEMFFQIGFTQA